MKLIKATILLSFAIIFISGTEAFAQDLQMTRSGNNPVNITFCDTEEAAARLAWAGDSTPFEERNLAIAKAKLDLKCHTEMQAPEYTLHKKTNVKIENARHDYEIFDVIYQPNNQHKFIYSRAIGPYGYTDTSCEASELGGQVNRMEADKDGRLYLKKYMVTSECVNGKSKAVWKPLN